MIAKPSIYEFIEQSVDPGIIMRGPDVEGLFSNAARAMTELIVTGKFGDKQQGLFEL
jgi:SHS2 domain-containing protein